MKILFLHEVNYLTKPIFEMHEFPEHLARLGHEIGFVHFPEGYTQSQIRELGWRKRISGRVVAGVELDLFTPWTFSGGLLGRLFSATVSYWQFKRVLREFQPDVVVSFSVPTSGWQALLACKKAGVPYVIRALDVSHRIRKNVFSSLVREAEKFVYKNANALSANNPSMLEYCVGLGSRHGLSSVHFPIVDLGLFSGGDRLSGRSALGISMDVHATVYLGSFFYFSGLEQVIRKWKSRESAGVLVLIGGGEQDTALRSLVSDLGLESKVIFAGYKPFSELPDLLAASDLGINPMEPSLVSHSALPNKVLQYLASGLQVASTALSGLAASLPPSSAITWCSSSDDVAEFASNAFENFVQRQSNQRDLLNQFGSVALDRFEAFLEQVVKEKN